MPARAFILGGYVNGLGLVRSLARIGFRSLVFDIERSIAGSSRWASSVRCPHPTEDTDAFLHALKSMAAEEAERPVVFATNDIWLVPILEHEAELRQFLRLPMSRWDVVRACYDKWQLVSLAEQHGIPTPMTFRVRSPDQLRQLEGRVPYPAILKPVDTIGFMQALGRSSRNIKLESQSDLFVVAAELERAGLTAREMIVQEYIPGGTEELFTYTSYSNGEGHVLAWSVGHKIRQWPEQAGTITAGRVVRNAAVERIGEALIHAVGFHGIANTEFKRDVRTGEFKLIEINPRPGMWNRSALATGVNLPAMAYLEANGPRLERVGSTDKTVVWVDILADAYRAMRRRPSGTRPIGLREWWRSLDGEKVDAVFDASDPMPFVSHCIASIRQLVRHRGAA